MKVTIPMIENLVRLYGAAREKSRPIAGLGIQDGGTSNVGSAFDKDGDVIFNFAWRPHKPEPRSNLYTEEGLFIC